MKQRLIAIAVLFTTLTALASPLPAPHRSGESINKIVAIVNDEPITESAIHHGYQNARYQVQQQGTRMPSPATLKNQVLTQLIYQRLQQQIAKRNQMTISPAQIDQAIKNIAQNNHFSVATLKHKIAKQGVDYSTFRKSIGNQILMHQVQRQFVTEKVTASPSEIQDMLNHYQSQEKYSPQYHLVDILVPLPSSPTLAQTQQAKAQAAKIRQSLNNGATLSAIKGAEVKDMGWKSTAELPALFTHSLANVHDGSLSQLLSAGNGFHIIKRVATKKSSATLPTTQEIKRFIEQVKFQKAVQTWLKDLRKKSYVKIIDPQYQNA